VSVKNFLIKRCKNKNWRQFLNSDFPPGKTQHKGDIHNFDYIYPMAYYKDYSKRKKEITPLKEAFEELLQAYRLKDRFDERKVVSAWGEIMGNTVASRTTGIFVREKRLYVKLSSGPIKKELMMNKTKVLALIDEKFGKGTILDIVFQ